MFKRFLGFTILLLLCSILSSNGFCEELKIGYINLRKVFYEYKKTKEFNKSLEAEDEKAKKEIETRTQEVKKLRDGIDLLSEKAKEKKQPELKQKIKELDELRKEKVESIIRKKDEMFKEIRQDIMDTSAEYAKRNDYNVIFDEAILIYSSEKYDITDKIIKELNK